MALSLNLQARGDLPERVTHNDTKLNNAMLDDATRRSQLSWALTLVPYAGIAFLWFIGVIRSRLGNREDRLFATTFLGSGLIFVAMLFSSAALLGALLVLEAGPHPAPRAAFPSAS